MTRRTGRPHLTTATGQVSSLERVPFDDHLIDEGWLQDLLHESPELLPIDEIDPSWGPLISLGREIATTAGPIDNLFVSPQGRLTVVEAKLWRNPESRRKVIGQVLDYASALAALSYDELSATVANASSDAPSSLWQHVQDAEPDTDPADESAFVDTVTRGLRDSRFLLLVVGDGIHEQLESMAGLIGRHPDLGFHLELVEMQLYRVDRGDGHLVIPSLVGRTSEVSRAVVQVNVEGGGNVEVKVQAMAEQSPHDKSRKLPFASMDEYLALATADTGEGWAEHSRSLVQWWQGKGGAVVLNETSISLFYPIRRAANGQWAVLAVYASGASEFQNVQLSQVGLFDVATLDEDLRSRGFGGKKRITYRDHELDESKEQAIREALSMFSRRFEQADAEA